MEGIDAEVLISLVESKPVLWDKTLDIYKDRIATRKAWEEVCLALKPDFETIGDSEKNAFGKEVIRRWTNLRDCLRNPKEMRKLQNKVGRKQKKRKKYVFSDQLQFLNKIYTDNNTVDSLDPAIEPVNELDVDEEAGGSGAGDPDVSINTNLNLPTKKTSSQVGKRKHKKPDEIELKMLKALEPKLPCSKMSFLQSLMPHLDTFTGREFLQFQMGVLNVIENINKMKETISHPHPNYPPPSSMPSYQPVLQYMSQPPPVTQQQEFLHTHPPSFPPPQYHHNTTQRSNSFDQHHPVPPNQYESQNKPPHMTTPIIKSSLSKKETQSTSQYLQEFCYSDSSQSEQVTSPAISPSGESTYSDIF